jgi:hypothetical protein
MQERREILRQNFGFKLSEGRGDLDIDEKVNMQLSKSPHHEDIQGSRGIAPHIFNL